MGDPFADAFAALHPSDVEDEASVREQVFAAMGIAPGPARLGRYRVLRRLGQGGAGLVLLGEDDRLRRRVAIKLVRARPGAGESATIAERRLLREARAAARLAHPNVVAIYDVGRYSPREVEALGDRVAERGVYIVMELIEGVDLHEWLAAGSHSPEELLEVLCAAGRGLAAAHEVGLVHRDFKPANVLVGGAGMVKVADFGLARPPGRVDLDTLVQSASPVPSTVTLTAPGIIAGTLPYMAPEQLAGAVGPKVDQYAFCITLYEAFAGARPFRGDAAACYAAKLEGRVPPHPALGPTVRTVVERGLSPSPDERYPSMKALLHALVPRPRGNAWLPWALGVGALAAIGWTLEPDPCARPSSVSGHLERLASTASPSAAEALLDEARAISAAWGPSCDVGTGSDDPLATAARACIEDRTEVRARLTALTTSGDLTVEQLVAALGGLPAMQACKSSDAVADPLPAPDEAIAGDVRRLRAQIAGIAALGDAGQHARAAVEAEAVWSEARGLDYAPLRVEARTALARIEMERHRLDRAEEELLAAYWEGGEIGHVVEMSRTAGLLANLHGQHRRDPEAAEPWERHADAALLRIGDPPTGRAILANIQAANRLVAGRPDEAAALFQAAISALEGAGQERTPSIALTANNLGKALVAAGRLDEAELAIERSLSIRQELGGENDIAVAATLVHRAALRTAQDRDDDAIADLRRALDIIDTAAPGHAWRTVVLNNLGSIYGEQGRYDDAATEFLAAIEQLERQGTRDLEWAGLHENLATAYALGGRPEDAARHLALARTKMEVADPPLVPSPDDERGR